MGKKPYHFFLLLLQLSPNGPHIFGLKRVSWLSKRGLVSYSMAPPLRICSCGHALWDISLAMSNRVLVPKF